MEQLKRLFNLQMFNEGEPQGEAPQGEKSQGETPQGEKPQGEKPEEKQPFAIFPDQKSFMSRVEREARKIFNNSLKEVGIGSVDELKTLVGNYRDLESTTNSELIQRDELIKALQEENQSLVSRITNDTKNKALKNVALELGVDENRFDRFVRLVDMNAIEIVEGEVPVEPLKEQVTAILDEFPEFRGVTTASQGGASFNDGQGEKPKLTIDQIKSMTTKEILENYADVMSALGK